MKKILCVLFAGLMLLSLCSCGDNKETEAGTTFVFTQTEPESSEETTLAKELVCPKSFEELKCDNKEIYAYIYIPGTNISYPILRSSVDDNYYLRRNYKGHSSYRGCIYTQSGNSTDFTDPVTVVYGHNTDKGDMFSQLLLFQNQEFFDGHDTFYIYTPDETLVYKIFSAHTYDNRHILNSYDFSNHITLADFQETLLNPPSMERKVREKASLDDLSNIVILSTCAQPHSGSEERYLVNGVLTEVY